jgi:putative ABC transport system substrate-binding protein
MNGICRALLAAGASGMVLLAAAQETQPPYRVAVILTTTPVVEMAGPDPGHPTMRSFVHELRAFGYVEGRNLVLERRSAEGKPETYPGIVAELIRLRTDVIVTAGGGALFKRVKGMWDAVPVVMLGGDDPVPHGLAASLAHPGGNLTGLLVVTGPEHAAKRLQLLKEAIPTLSRVAYLSTRAVWELPISRAIREAAPSLGIELLHVEHRPVDLDATFADLERMRPDALFVSLGAESFGQRKQILRFATQARLPASYPFTPMVEDGGLMSYSVSVAGLGRGAARYVDRILKGARPGDLPIEAPTTFELVINLRTAKALGLTIPREVLLQADRVIE